MSLQSHKISQETFDETLLENQEVFELSPEDAVAETISQFKQQGIQDIESYVIVSHPESEVGMRERQTRKKFEGYLEFLDGCVGKDGTVNLKGVDNDLFETTQKVLKAIEGVSKYCDGSLEDENVKGETKCDRALPFLTVFHSSNSLYTFMSLLGVVRIDDESRPAEEEMMILNEVCRFLSSTLTPRRSSERQIKNLIKDKFVAMERMVVLISLFLAILKRDESKRRQTEAIVTLWNLMKLASSVCRNSERSKVAFVRALKNSKQNVENVNTIQLLVDVLSVSFEMYKADNAVRDSRLVSLMAELLTLVCVLCRYDDFRPEGSGSGLGIDSSYGMNVSSAHDHVMEFHRYGIVPLLYDISNVALTTGPESLLEFCTDESGMKLKEEDMVSLAGASLSATRVIAVNDEIVQALVAVGILKVVNMALTMGIKDLNNTDMIGEDITNEATQTSKQDRIRKYKQQLTASAIGLVRNLCGNDEIKTNLCLGSTSDPSSSSLHMVLEGMRLYRDNALIQEHGLGALAAMALRKPANSLRIVQENGPREIVAAMAKYPNNVLVQRQGALAVRNIVSRLVTNNSSGDNSDPDGSAGNEMNDINVKDAFLDLGAEVILRQITGRHQGSVDEAYAALRDLGCEVSMLKYDTETNTITRKTQMFGEVKSNFRAVYDESDDIEGKVANVAN